MQTVNLETYQQLLEQFKHCQSEIDYTRYLGKKKDYQWVIENNTYLDGWYTQLQQTIGLIEKHSESLQAAITQNRSHSAALQALELAIDQLVELHTDIAKSYAHQADLMEGRYLILHAVGSCLDAISAQINEFRFQLGQYLFNCDQQKQLDNIELSVVFTLSADVEMKAFQEWSKHSLQELSRNSM